MNLKIKEPDYKDLYLSRQEKISSQEKTISGLKSRNTKLENEIIKLKWKCNDDIYTEVVDDLKREIYELNKKNDFDKELKKASKKIEIFITEENGNFTLQMKTIGLSRLEIISILEIQKNRQI